MECGTIIEKRRMRSRAQALHPPFTGPAALRFVYAAIGSLCNKEPQRRRVPRFERNVWDFGEDPNIFTREVREWAHYYDFGLRRQYRMKQPVFECFTTFG